MTAKPSFWRDMAVKARKDAKVARSLGYEEIAEQNERFAEWCKTVEKQQKEAA